MRATGLTTPGEVLITHCRLGAQTLQASLGDGLAIFYLSPLGSASAKPASARGGVPILFPQFAELGPLVKHGFARTAQWRLVGESASAGLHSIQYELDIDSKQFAGWPHAARLDLRSDASPGRLVLRLEVINTGDHAFGWTGGLHPYFAVDDLLATTVTGLAGLPVKDRYNAALQIQPGGPVGWGEQAFERLYDGCPALVLSSGRVQLELSASGFDQWMAWNPGRQGAAAMADLPSGDWQRFVCLEPVCVGRPVMLAPGNVFTGTLQVRAATA
ncbi:MAG: hypothetical protein ACRERX_11225 [Pseudomonas sp.]